MKVDGPDARERVKAYVDDLPELGPSLLRSGKRHSAPALAKLKAVSARPRLRASVDCLLKPDALRFQPPARSDPVERDTIRNVAVKPAVRTQISEETKASAKNEAKQKLQAAVTAVKFANAAAKGPAPMNEAGNPMQWFAAKNPGETGFWYCGLEIGHEQFCHPKNGGRLNQCPLCKRYQKENGGKA